MKVVNIHEAKTHFSKLLAEVEAGEEVVIARAGKPIAKLTLSDELPPKRKIGFGRDLLPNLSEEEWDELDREYRSLITKAKPWHEESF